MITRGQSGSATTELVLVFPTVLFLVLLVFQFALLFHSRNLVMAAAQDGARAARTEHGTEQDGEHAVRTLLAESGATLEDHVRVGVDRSEDVVRVWVQARVIAVVPGLRLDVDATSTAPVERFRSTP